VKRVTYFGLRLLSSLQYFLRERLTAAGWLVFAAAATAAAVGIDTSRTMSYQMFAFLATLLVAAFAAAPFFRPRVLVQRDLPRYATAGEAFEYRVTVENRGKRALSGVTLVEVPRDPRPSYREWLSAREPGEERRNWFDRTQGYFRWRWLIERRSLERPREAPLGMLAPGARARLKLSLKPRRRGRVELAGLALARGDSLGLARALARLRAPGAVIALPRRYRLPAITLPGRRRFQQGGVTLATSVGDSEEFIGLREYRPGDPLQRVHWKSSARARTPIVKEFQDEFFERHALILDTSTARGEDAAFEEAVAVAASFVYAIDTRECLLDLLFVGGELRTYTAGRGQLHMEHMLEVLAGVRSSAPVEFGQLARAVLAQRRALSSCIAVLLGWDPARQAFVQALAASGLELRVLVVAERQALASEPPAGILVLHPGEVEAGLARLR